jgi:LPXTG-motif cell wall-anchored protein
LAVTSFVILLLSSAPALAQSASAAANQYAPGPCTTDYCVESIEEGIQDTIDTAAEGTKALNEALSGTASPQASVPAVNSAGSSPDKVAGLTELPETGGPSLLAAGAGVLLVASGLLVRRAFR